MDSLSSEKKIEAWEARMIAEAESKKCDELLERGVPKRLVSASLDSWKASTVDQQRTIATIQAFLPTIRSGRSLILYGRPGTGKTHLAVGIMRHFVGAVSLRYATASGLAREVRCTYSRSSSEDERDVLNRHVKVGLLVLDEVGVGIGSAHERAMLHDVLAGRYDLKRPTILVSNLDLAALQEALGDRLVDRLREDDGIALGFTWSSHRGVGR